MKKTIAVLSALAIVAGVQAESVTDWYYTSGGNNSGLDTASPILGDGTTDNADNIKLNGSFTEVSLLDGETITLSGGVTFTGMNGTYNDQFRFGLFDDLGDADPATWDGYRSVNIGAIRLAGNSTENPTTYTGSQIGSTTGYGDLQNDTSYAFSLSLTRNGGGIDLVSNMTDGVNTFAEASLNHASADTFDFNTVGLLSGGNFNSDQTSFSNIEVTVIPEPATLSMIALFGVGVVFIRRRLMI